MVLKHYILAPLIINYRMGRDLMKIFTFKWPSTSVRKHIFLISNRCSSDGSQAITHNIRVHTYVTHIACAHEHIPCIIINYAFTLSPQKSNWWTEQRLQLFSVQLSGVNAAESKGHDSKMEHNNEGNLQICFSLCKKS